MNEQLTLVLLLAIGGIIGTLLRFGMSLVLPNTGGIGWSTLTVNFIGCTLITLVIFSLGPISFQFRAFLVVGIFGAFTTMSSVSLETIDLFFSGMMSVAFLNFALNMLVCLGGGILGRVVAMTLAL